MSRSRTMRFALRSGVLAAVLALAGIPAVHAQTTAPADTTPAAVQTEEASKTESSQGEMAQKQIADAIQSIKLSYAFQLYLQARDTGSGQYGTESTTDIFFKRNRLMLSGQVSDIVGFYAAIQYQGDERIYGTTVSETPAKNFDMLDTYLTADWSDAVRLRVGLTKDPLVRESNESCFEPLSVDRSLFAYTNVPRLNRDFGAVLWGNIADALIQYRVAAMKGNDDINDPKSVLRYTARAHVSLLDPEYSISYKGTYLGKKRVLTLGAGYQVESDAVYGNVAGFGDVKDYKAYTYDLFFEYPTKSGTFTVSGAYLQQDLGEAYKGADPDPRSVGLNGEKNGWYAKAGYLLPRKIGGADLQVFGRYEEWRFAQLQSIYDQEIKWTAFGANYYINAQDLRLTLEYSMNDYVKEDAVVKDFTTWTLMLQFRI